MEQNFIRPDFLFSYWIFTWFFIYYIIQITTANTDYISIKENLNPKLSLIIALIENIILFVFLLIKNTKLYVLFIFILTTTLFKIIPIYLVYGHTIKLPNDILSFAGLFLIYNVYLLFWRTNVYEVTQRTAASLSAGKTYTPFFYLLHKMSII